MKKILVMLAAVSLLAVGCSTYKGDIDNNSAAQQNKPNVNASGNVDATVDALGQSVNAEQSLQTQSDMDIVNSDSAAIINSSNGVNYENN